jgi:hypothetical protein
VSGGKGRTPGSFRGRFQASRWIGVRIRPGGFEVEGELQDELRGRVVKTAAMRKRFEDGVLACRSPNGEKSEDGVLCAQCLHPDCRPLLRVQLLGSGDTYVLDLPHSSARNLILLEDELARGGRELLTTDLALTVEDRGYWGEVRFRVD